MLRAGPGDASRSARSRCSSAPGRRLGPGRQRRTGGHAGRPTRTPRCRPATDLTLALRGRLLEAEDQRLVGAFAAQAAVVLDHIRLSRGRGRGRTARGGQQGPRRAAGRGRARPAHATRRGQGGGLDACSASTSTSRPTTVATCSRPPTTSLDRLAALVDNLLDMSRLQAGAMSIDVQPTAVDEVVARALDDLGEPGRGIVIDAADDAPPGAGRPRPAGAGGGQPRLQRAALLAASRRRRTSTSSRLGDRVEIRVIDRGPGHPARRLGPGLPAVPAPRRHRQHHRRRARPRALPRPDRGDGRNPRCPRRPPVAASPWSSRCRR